MVVVVLYENDCVKPESDTDSFQCLSAITLLVAVIVVLDWIAEPIRRLPVPPGIVVLVLSVIL
jgi:hypothetical protein